MGGSARGNFGSYRKSDDMATYPDDEDAITEACETMLGLCGNAGQERMIGDLLPNFDEWALTILEDESAHEGSSWEEFLAMLLDWYEERQDKVEGTEDIWAEGWTMIAEQSGYHDRKDEYGEGTGGEFGQ